MVTRNSYRILHTLYNLKPSAEPNLTVLWSENLPAPFKRFCAKVSCDTDAIQYENDDLMRPRYGDDYAIACCVSAMKVGKQMQFFGARANLAKLLLMSLNGGRDEKSGDQVGPVGTPYQGDVLEYDRVLEAMAPYREWLCGLYVNTMNVIHAMHDKYAYEKTQMALHDTDVHRFMAFGAAGMSVLADSLSAIRYATVRPIRDESGLIIDFSVEGVLLRDPAAGKNFRAPKRSAGARKRQIRLLRPSGSLSGPPVQGKGSRRTAGSGSESARRCAGFRTGVGGILGGGK